MAERRTVTTQAELDAALADKAETIYIQSPEGVWLRLGGDGSSHVVAWGSSHVVAWGSSHVEAWGSSHVVARESSHVVAWESSHVVARESSHVVAWGSSHVEAWGSSHVVAAAHVAVHLHSARAEIQGGVLIDLTALNLTDPAAWCEYHGVSVVGGVATVYKAVDDEWQAGHGYTLTTYTPGTMPECDDFRPDGYCGGGLHFGPTVSHALAYNSEATKYLAVGVAVSEMNIIDGNDHSYTAKCKAPRVVTPCVEVDRYGTPVAALGGKVAG